jgi:transposase-like protein
VVNTLKPTCPYCGHVERDAWEIDFGPGLDGDTEHTCHSCGKDYFLSREVTVRYASHKLDRKHQADSRKGEQA